MSKCNKCHPLFFYGCTVDKPMNWFDMSGFVNVFVPYKQPPKPYYQIVVFTRRLTFDDQKLFGLDEINELPIK